MIIGISGQNMALLFYVVNGVFPDTMASIQQKNGVFWEIWSSEYGVFSAIRGVYAETKASFHGFLGSMSTMPAGISSVYRTKIANLGKWRLFSIDYGVFPANGVYSATKWRLSGKNITK